MHAVYQVLISLSVGVTVLISYTDRATLYCPSNDLLESINEATSFCVLTGLYINLDSVVIAIIAVCLHITCLYHMVVLNHVKL